MYAPEGDPYVINVQNWCCEHCCSYKLLFKMVLLLAHPVVMVVLTIWVSIINTVYHHHVESLQSIVSEHRCGVKNCSSWVAR